MSTKLSIWILATAVALSLPLSIAHAQTKIISTSTTLSEDTTWEDLVIVDSAKVTVAPNATLTIKPGTIVSGKNGALLYVMGKLKAMGETDRKIKFTAEPNEKPSFSLTYYVDSTTTSEIELEHFILEGGGGNQDTASLPALTIRGKATLEKGMIRRNLITGVRVWSGNVKISDSEIYENESVAVENKSTTSTLKAENNWWGAEDGPTPTAIPNSPRAVVKGAVDFDPWQKKGPIPIVILPGFGGSFSFKLFSGQAKDEWWLPSLGTSAYRYFAKALILSNYYHDKDFFWGFYDWRQSCDDSAKEYLEKIIENAQIKSGHSQVHIVAHSMGGLVARSYIQGADFRDDVDRLVTAGTPHLGASDVYPIWEGGQLLDGKKPFYLYLWYLQTLNWDWNRTAFIRQNFPSLGEMMPIYDYLKNDASGELIGYKNQKVKNRFLEDLSDPENVARLTRRVNSTIILGDGESTLEQINVRPYGSEKTKWEDGIPEPLDPPRDTDRGDGTVTVKSASANGQITKNVITVAGDHSRVLQEGAKPILEQLKVKAKFPLLFKLMSTFLLTANGSADAIIKDGLGNILSADINEVADGRFAEQTVDGQKLTYAELPRDSDSAAEKNLELTFRGRENGRLKAALWNFPASEDYSKQEIEIPLAKGMAINYSVTAGEDSVSYSPHPSVKNLMVLIDRWYGEQKIGDWETRRRLINWLAEAYQAESNGRPETAREKISVASHSLTELPDSSVKKFLTDSLQNPKFD